MSIALKPETIRLIDWAAITEDLDRQGWSVLPRLISEADCDAAAALYDAKRVSAAGSSWRAMVSGAGNIAISPTLCPR